jgi:hypothetical protein
MHSIKTEKDMKKGLAFLSLGLTVMTPAPAQTQEVTDEVLIAQASAAAPASYRAGAEVRAYGEDGSLWTVREGTNELICLADRPGDEGFASACYHVSLEPFMQRGRELSAEGITGQDRQLARWAEVDEGKIPMPDGAAMVYNLRGQAADFDSHTRYLTDAQHIHAAYIPFATPESTGLSAEPNQGGPWIMMPGRPSAHIMFSFKGEAEAAHEH